MDSSVSNYIKRIDNENSTLNSKVKQLMNECDDLRNRINKSSLTQDVHKELAKKDPKETKGFSMTSPLVGKINNLIKPQQNQSETDLDNRDRANGQKDSRNNRSSKKERRNSANHIKFDNLDQEQEQGKKLSSTLNKKKYEPEDVQEFEDPSLRMQ